MDDLCTTLSATRWGAAITRDQLNRVAAESQVIQVGESGFVRRRGEPVDAWLGVLDGLVKLMNTEADAHCRKDAARKRTAR
jgi:CRP/FNR family cyclic AMP-dependent transcriptional regulator